MLSIRVNIDCVVRSGRGCNLNLCVLFLSLGVVLLAEEVFVSFDYILDKLCLYLVGVDSDAFVAKDVFAVNVAYIVRNTVVVSGYIFCRSVRTAVCIILKGCVCRILNKVVKLCNCVDIILIG